MIFIAVFSCLLILAVGKNNEDIETGKSVSSALCHPSKVSVRSSR